MPTQTEERRKGDSIEISGDYQHRAVASKNPVQKFWHTKKYSEAENWLQVDSGDLVLDVGCGSGVLAGQLARANPNSTIIGVDTNESALDFCNSHYDMPNLSFKEGLVDELQFKANSVSKIAFLEVLEHISESQGLETLRGFHNILAPKGRLVLTTPNYSSMWPLIEYALDSLKLVPQLAEEQHVAKYSRPTLIRLSQEAGFKVIQARSSHVIAPWLSLLSTGFAERIHEIEQSKAHGLGSLLLFVLEKQE